MSDEITILDFRSIIMDRISDIKLKIDKTKHSQSICRDQYKLQQYRERIITLERSLEINERLINETRTI